MKAVIYARCNSQNQVENSIERQIKTCEEYAKEKGYTITKKYIDVGSREQFEKMIKNSSKKKFQAVIIYSLDRFARNRYNFVLYKNKLKKNGVKLVSTKENIENDASGILLESVLEGMYEYYSQELSPKIKKEIMRKIEERERIANEG